MRNLFCCRIPTVALLILAPLALIWTSTGTAEPTIDASRLRTADTFDEIGSEHERSVALFTEAGKVLTHARCVNCHPAGDRPLQGEDGELHQPMVSRGGDGFGAVGMRCGACHQAENFDPGQVPGSEHWHLAPIEMAWENKSLGEICEQIKDPARNGDRSLDEIVHHMRDDPLVAWAWAPGAGRRAAPGSQTTFAELIRAWAETGAACPDA